MAFGPDTPSSSQSRLDAQRSALFSAHNPYGQPFSLRRPTVLQEGYPDDQRKDHQRARSYETNRDVKWICRTLRRREAQDEEFEARIRALEGWRAEKAGEERRVSTISAGAGGVVGGVVAVIVRVLGRG